MNTRRKTVIALVALPLGAMALIALALNSVDAGVHQAATELVAQYVAAPPQVDGVADPVWEAVPALNVQVVGGANAGSHQVSLKSIYTDEEIYFLAHWTDPTQSLHRFPWVKQEDGTWKQMKEGVQGDENVHYEDKFAFIWNINNSISGFNQAGCMITCHAGEPNKPYGNKYTQTAGERGDIWHWKSVRTGPVGQVDDQYVDDMRWSADTPEAGRHSDPKQSGGYADNKNADGTAPSFAGPKGQYWILDSEKQAFADNYQPGDEVAGIVVAPITGDRGDIPAQAVYSGDGWTLELRRKLVTGSDKDVQFNDLGQAYHFGVAVFDNAQVRHAFETGVSALKFAPKPTAVAATSWGQIKKEMK